MKFDRRGFIGWGAGSLAALALADTSWGKQSEAAPLSFIQVSDTHLPAVSGKVGVDKMVRAVEKLKLPYEFIVHTGDITDGYGDMEEFKAARAALTFSKPIHFLPGNHDVTFDYPSRHEPDFAQVFGPANTSFEPRPGLRFVMFNSQLLADRAGEENWARAFDLLDRLLTPVMPTVFFCHAVGIDDFYENEHHPGWSRSRLERWFGRMTDGGVFAVLAGHFHRDERAVIHGLPAYFCPPIVGWFGRQPSFRVWSLAGQELSYRTIYL